MIHDSSYMRMSIKNALPTLSPDTGARQAETPANLRLDLSKVDRRTGLRTWMIYHGISEKQLATGLGVSPSTVTRLLSGERRNRELLDKLVSMGIPASLLLEDD